MAQEVVVKYLKELDLVSHQTDSYHRFIYHDIPHIIGSASPITHWAEHNPAIGRSKYEVQLHIENLRWEKPRMEEASRMVRIMTPYDARMRNFTYAAVLYVAVRAVVKEYGGEKYENVVATSEFVCPKVHFGRVPVMVGSKLCVMDDLKASPHELRECERDPGGYFIAKGGERVLLAAEKVADNRIMVYYDKKKRPHAPYCAEIKSLSEATPMTPKKIELFLSSKFNGIGFPITGIFPRLTGDIPIAILFRVLGVVTDDDILQCIWPEYSRRPDVAPLVEAFAASLFVAGTMKIFTREQAVAYVAGHGAATIRDVAEGAWIDAELLPNCANSNTAKAITLGRMVDKLLRVHAGWVPLDNRDAYKNKRIVLPGTLLSQRYRQLYMKAIKDMKSKLNIECNKAAWKKDGANKAAALINLASLSKIIRMTTVEKKLQQAITTGSFGSDNSTAKNGVSQVLNRLSYHATLSHLRRIQTPVERAGKLTGPRKLDGSSFGFMCPYETPEGAQVGLVKAIAMGAAITMAQPGDLVIEQLKRSGLPLLPLTGRRMHDVLILVNNCPCFLTRDPAAVYDTCKSWKLTGVWHPHISVAWFVDQHTIEIETDMGRMVRLVADLHAPHVSKVVGVGAGAEVVEAEEDAKLVPVWVSPLETETLLIAPSMEDATHNRKSDRLMRYTHAEIDGSLHMGYMASLVPFPEHNQGPRICYSTNMSKQGVGLYATNHEQRMTDKNAFVLLHPQKPIVHTRVYDALGLEHNACGRNMIVAIQCYTGYNQEDSLVMNGGSAERGILDSVLNTVYTDEINTNVSSGKDERFMKPDSTCRGFIKDVSYEALREDGVPALHARVHPEDIVIGKVMASRDGSAYKDVSTAYRGSEDATVHGVFMSRNADGCPSMKVRLQVYRKPCVANKLSSMHAQKGTIGLVLPEADMPFTASGLKPDLIMNPHAIPSRMTIGHVMEMLLGKAVAGHGAFGDGTAYAHLGVDEIRDLLLAAGMDDAGDEYLYNGMTGERIKCKIFMGTTYYMALKHMVADKFHVRSSGRVMLLTRQPNEGRSRDGGFRVGEMERDALLGHGAASMIQERLMKVSDAHRQAVCRKCGGMPVYNQKECLTWCRRCDNRVDIGIVEMPYAMKLLCQEMGAIGIEARIVL
jgi:DNA-directed RNA polymerase II subunit RPB2